MTNNTLKQYALYKYLGICIGVAFGLIQPTFFSKFFTQDDFAFLLLVYGIATYLIFFDFGISKPIYALLRKKFVANEPLNNTLMTVLPFYNVVILVLSISFITGVLIFSSYYSNTFNALVLIFLALSVGLNVGLNYIENILNAIDQQIFFQKIDIFRKIANLSTLFLLFLDDSFILTMIVNASILFILYVLATRKIYINYFTKVMIWPESLKVFLEIIKMYWKKSYQYLVFSINETLIYNGGFIFVPMFLSSFYIIQYGLWMKLFLGIALFIKVIIEIFIHKITKYYFNGDISEAQKWFFVALLSSALTGLFFVLSLYLLNDLLFSIWVSKIYAFEPIYFISLFIWLIGLSIQSVSGTFMLSEGNQFVRMKNISLVVMTCTLLTFLFSLVFEKDLGLALFLTSLIYFFGAFVYLRFALSLFKIKGSK